MIQHINVHEVLQQSVAGFYADLVTRPTGRAVRESIERTLPAGTIAVMDFTGVGCLDYSCADEIVAKLVREKVRVLLLRCVRAQLHQSPLAVADAKHRHENVC